MDISNNIVKRLELFKNLVAEYRAGVFFHANLFFSPDKTTNDIFCRQVAKMLVCECGENGCDHCGNCLKIEKGTNPDVMFFGNTKFAVADVEKIVENQVLKPMISPCKVYVINKIDNATIQAQNKLLKVLEEPNPNVFFIINATNLDSVLPTVKSRCKIMTIEPFDFGQIKEIFEDEKTQISEILYSQSGGYVGKLMELCTGGDFADSLNLARGIVFDMKNSKQVLGYSSELSSSKATFLTKLSLIQELYRDIMLSLLGQVSLQQSKEFAGKIEQVKNEFTVDALVEIIDKIDLCKKQFDANVNIGMIADGLLMKILEVKYLCKQK